MNICFLKYDYPLHYGDWCFSVIPPAYEKYKRFLSYSEPYTKHYSFEILCKKIDLNNLYDTEFIKNLDAISQTENNDDYKSVEFIFNKYHENWKNFYVVKKSYEDGLQIDVLNTNYLYLDNSNNEYFNNYFYNKDTNYIVTEPDYNLIKEFQCGKKPLYMYMLPEDISHFNVVYPEMTDEGLAIIYAKSDNYLYFIFSQR
jgi:hypothetical protein